MLYAYELAALRGSESNPANGDEWRALKSRIEKLLTSLDIAADSKLARWADERCAQLAQDDVHFLHKLLAKVEEKL